jgi:DNA-binding CsgD family transcriptional regulator
MHREDEAGTTEWGKRALDLAAQLDDREIEVYALLNIGNVDQLKGRGVEKLERSLQLALETGLEEHAGRAFVSLTWWWARGRTFTPADEYFDRGLEYCTERGLDLWRHFLLAYRARSQLDRGRWDDAVAAAAPVLRDPRTSPVPRITALAVLGLVRARRGDPEVWPALDEAWAAAEPTDELQRIEPVAVARVEAFWLQGQLEHAAEAARPALELAIERQAAWIVGELACWRKRAGVEEDLHEDVPDPWAAELAGDWRGAAKLWDELAAPYEAALARIASDDPETLSQALADLRALGARPAAAIVARRLRQLGVRSVPRGPRAATKANPAGLTARQVEVLGLLAEGLPNIEIAARLVLSTRTVDHHVSAILRKLNARTRGEAAATWQKISSPGRET